LHDSVFEQYHKTPPDLSPLLARAATLTPTKEQSSNSFVTKSNEKNLIHQHHNRYFHFEENPNLINNNEMGSSILDSGGSNASGKKGHSGIVFGSGSKKLEKTLTSPNLSPIRQQNSKSTNCTLQASSCALSANKKQQSINQETNKSSKSSRRKKVTHSSNKETNQSKQNKIEEQSSEETSIPSMNVSTCSNFAKSIIFMDIGDTECIVNLSNSKKSNLKELQNVSFTEEIIDYEHHNHYKREEFYKNVSFGDDQFNYTKESKQENNHHNILNSNQNLETSKSKNVNKFVNEQLASIETSKNITINTLNSNNDSNPINITATINSTNTITTNNNTINNQNEYFFKSATNPNIKYLENNVLNTSKPFLTTMNSMIETTTNTFNQDSQDTGYQTNSGNYGNGF
jgi:hypothetical protein